MKLEFNISFGTDPIYRQIINQVQRAVATALLEPGDSLPSIRALAERLVINPNTVARAYRDLVQDGVIESRQGVGYVVAERRRVFSDAERRRRLDQALEPLIQEAFLLGLQPDEIAKALERKLTARRKPQRKKRSS